MFRDFYFLKRPDHLWVLPSPLLNRYQSSCPELALFVCEVDRLDLPSNTEQVNLQVIPIICLHAMDRESLTFTFKAQ